MSNYMQPAGHSFVTDFDQILQQLNLVRGGGLPIKNIIEDIEESKRLGYEITKTDHAEDVIK